MTVPEPKTASVPTRAPLTVSTPPLTVVLPIGGVQSVLDHPPGSARARELLNEERRQDYFAVACVCDHGAVAGGALVEVGGRGIGEGGRG